MKKNYIIPEITICKLRTIKPIAASNPQLQYTNDRGAYAGGTVLSRSWDYDDEDDY